MKVVVRCAHNRVTKADMEREIERLFQENKDLRVHVGHLRDELNLSQQQSEARRQVICERDKLIQKMDEELASAKTSIKIQRGFCEEMAEEIEALEKELAKSESESSQGINAMVKFWEEAVTEKNKAEERAEEYRIALMESDCRVDELEKRIEWLQNERKLYENNVERLTNERDTVVNESAELIFKINELRDKWEAEHNLHAVANKRLEELQEEHNELEADYDALAKTKREYGEEIDRLRKVVIELQTNRFTYDKFIGMIMKNFVPSADE